jgi:hypothetical protein
MKKLLAVLLLTATPALADADVEPDSFSQEEPYVENEGEPMYSPPERYRPLPPNVPPRYALPDVPRAQIQPYGRPYPVPVPALPHIVDNFGPFFPYMPPGVFAGGPGFNIYINIPRFKKHKRRRHYHDYD